MTRLALAWKALTQKTVRDERQWIASTVYPGEGMGFRYGRSDLAAFMLRGNGYPGIWADLNSSVCASQVMRLYRRAGEPSKGVRGSRKAQKSAVGHMRSGLAGAKAAEWSGQSGDLEEVTDHPVLDFLTRPNRFWRGREQDQMGYWCREISGNWFEEIVRENVKPFGLVPVARYPLWPQYTSIVPDREGFIGGYSYGRSTADTKILDPTDVVHFRFAASPTDPYYGRGPLHSVMAYVDLVAANLDHDLHFAANGMRPDAVAYVPIESTDTQVQSARSDVERMHRGGKNSWRWIFLRGTKLEPIGWNPKDLQSMEKLEAAKREIRNAMGIPESMAELNSANLASAKVGFDSQYLAATIKPRINVHAETLTEVVLPMFGIEAGEYFFAHDDPVPDNWDFMLQEHTGRVNAGMMTINEARSERGDDPIDGGDELRFNGIPLDQVGQQANPLVTPYNSIRDDRAATDEKNRHPAYHSAPCKCVSCSDLRTKATKDSGDDGIRRAVADWINSIEPPTGESVDLSARTDALAESLRVELERVMLAEASKVSGVEFDVADSALRFLDTYTVRLASAIAEETESNIRSAIRAGIESGASVSERSRAVASALKQEADYRSERIARTETATAQGAGRVEGYKAVGYTAKRWLLAANACEFCRAAAKKYGTKAIPIDEPFYRVGDVIQGDQGGTMTVTWKDVQYAPLHPNDRCGIEPVKEET